MRERGPQGDRGDRGFDGRDGMKGGKGDTGTVVLDASFKTKFLLIPIVCAFIIASAMAYLVTRQLTHTVRAESYAAQVAACERGKLDRGATVRVYDTLAAYYQGVTEAASVKSDVKRIAGATRDSLTRSATDLRKRLDPPFDCRTLFPRP